MGVGTNEAASSAQLRTAWGFGYRWEAMLS